MQDEEPTAHEKQPEPKQAESLPWPQAVKIVEPHTVRISTPRGSGTGFFFHRSKSSYLIGIATAAHVVEDSEYWEEPLRLEYRHDEKVTSVLVHEAKRVIFLDKNRDSATIVVSSEQLPDLPNTPLPLGLKECS